MSDISVSERRLSAALDRIDQYLDSGGIVHGGSTTDLHSELDAAHAQIAALKARSAPSHGTGTDAGDLADHAARLAAANDELAAANRVLIQAAAGNGDRIEAVSVALEAEIEALRAARAAESAQLGALLTEVERLLAEGGTTEATPEIAGDAGGVPEAGHDTDAQDEDR